MHINGVEIEDTFAEAFKMWGARLIVTAADLRWAQIAAQEATGFATSVIACGAEAGIEADLPASETPDGRPGVSILVFTMGSKGMQEQLMNRVGQCIMTCASTACFDGLKEGQKTVSVGGQLRYFGDGYQISKLLEGRRLWRIPVMEGEFVVDEIVNIQKAVGGGNFLILGRTAATTLEAAKTAVEAIRAVDGVTTPFPGGIVRSGSKTWSKYKFLRASTNSAYCPTLRGQVESALPEGVNSVLEIVIDGLSEEAVAVATRVGVEAACRPGIVRISAGNYGGTLGQYQFHLHRLLASGE
ncbi:MAG: formylmethanofuran--tetrahydromethanopterin N-formyltransferase [Anaerolineae bacterium]|jgi:formylmethanofuran--tetrahydromethanopterin N-formyltransferase